MTVDDGEEVGAATDGSDLKIRGKCQAASSHRGNNENECQNLRLFRTIRF